MTNNTITHEVRSGKFVDLTGLTFNKLTVVSFAGFRPKPKRKALWLCRCICGRELVVVGNQMKTGRTKSCGCFKRKEGHHRTHGKTKTPTYSSWQAMKARCFRKTSIQYKDYGGRGIRVCERWQSFANFLLDMGEKPKGHSIERKDNNGNYTPENCCWASSFAQARNTRRSVRITINGETKTLPEWAETHNLNYRRAETRIRQGWPAEEALFSPCRHPNAPKPRRKKALANIDTSTE